MTGFLPQLKGSAIRNDDGKAGGLYIPNFVNIGGRAGSGNFIRGYAMSASGGAQMYPPFAATLPGFGSGYKNKSNLCIPRSPRVLVVRRGDAGAQRKLCRT